MADTVTTMANALKRVYSPEVLDFFQNLNAEFWMKLEKLKLHDSEIGSGLYFRLPLQSAQNITTTAEGGAYPTPVASTYVQGSVTLAQFSGDIEVSNILAAAGAGNKGAWKSVMKDEMKTNLDDMTKHINRIYAGTHGTGRLAQVNATTTSATTWVGKLPYGVLLLRPNMRISVYTADSSGSVRDSCDDVKITKITRTTRTVTFGSGYSLTANDHVYMSGSYGNSPNGLAGLVDDGTNLTTIHGNSRDTYEELKSVVLGNSGTVRNQTEDHMIQGALQVMELSGAQVDTVLMGRGQLMEYYQYTRPDRRFQTSGSGVPKYDTGWDGKPTVHLNGRPVPIEVITDIAPRTIYGITKATLGRIGDDRPHWRDLGNGNLFAPSLIDVSSVTKYATSKQAFLDFLSNIVLMAPNQCFRIDDLSDLLFCGAYVGGSDT